VYDVTILFHLLCVHRPIISTDNGDLKFSTTGDLVFEAGTSSSIRFQSADGQAMQPPSGFKGEKVNKLQPLLLYAFNTCELLTMCKVFFIVATMQ